MCTINSLDYAFRRRSFTGRVSRDRWVHPFLGSYFSCWKVVTSECLQKGRSWVSGFFNMTIALHNNVLCIHCWISFNSILEKILLLWKYIISLLKDSMISISGFIDVNHQLGVLSSKYLFHMHICKIKMKFLRHRKGKERGLTVPRLNFRCKWKKYS